MNSDGIWQKVYDDVVALMKENSQLRQEIQRLQRDLVHQKRAIVLSLLEAVDAFHRVLAAVVEAGEGGREPPFARNFTNVFRILMARLREMGVAPLDTSPGQEVDPRYHRVVEVLPGTGDTDVVVQVLKPGYIMDGEVLREAEIVALRKRKGEGNG